MTTKFDVESAVEESRNLLRVRFHGHVTANAMKVAVDDIKEHLRIVRPGFTVLTDLSDLEGWSWTAWTR